MGDGSTNDSKFRGQEFVRRRDSGFCMTGMFSLCLQLGLLYATMQYCFFFYRKMNVLLCHICSASPVL